MCKEKLAVRIFPPHSGPFAILNLFLRWPQLPRKPSSFFNVSMPPKYARKGLRRTYARKPVSYARRKYATRGKGSKAAWARKPIQGRIDEQRGERPVPHYLTSASLAQRGGTLWPERIFTKLKYTELLIFTSTSGAVSANIYSQNSLFDPNVTGTGHQPLGFDQLSVLYSAYKVYGSKITCRCYQIGTGTQAALTGSVSILSSASNTSSSVGSTVAERDSGVTRTVGTAGSSPNVISSSTRTGIARGETPSRVRYDPNYSSGIGASPAIQTYWHVYYNTADQATTSVCNMNVDLEYDCEFTARIQPAQS